jgi:hypothetical protein
MNAIGYASHIPFIPSVVKCDKEYAAGTSISKITMYKKDQPPKIIDDKDIIY